MFVNNKSVDVNGENGNNYFTFSLGDDLNPGNFVTIDILSVELQLPEGRSTEPLFTAFELPAELAIPEPTLNLTLTSPYFVSCSTNADSYGLLDDYLTKLEVKEDNENWREEFKGIIEPDVLYQIKFSVLDREYNNKEIASVIRSVKVERDESGIAFPKEETDQVITWHNFTLASDAIAVEHKQTVGKL